MPDNKDTMAAIDKAIEEVKRMQGASKDSSAIVQAIQKELVAAIKPVMEAMALDIKDALKNVKIEVPKIEIPPIQVEMPPINVPEVKVPQTQVTVTPPAVNIPEMRMPDIVMPDHHETTLRGVGPKAPMPVMMYGTDGKPLMFPLLGGGGKANFLTIKDILTQLGNSVMDNTNNAINVNVVASSGLSITVAGSAVESTNTIQLGGNNIAVDSGVTGLGVQRIVHVTDVAMSVNVVGATGSLGVSVLGGDGAALDPRDRNWTVTETLTQQQLSGATDSVNIVSTVTLDTKQVSGGSHSVQINGTDVALDIKQVSGSVDSVKIASQDAAFEVRQVSGGNDSVTVTGATGTLMVVGDDLSDAADTGGAPVKVGGIARQTNPTAVSDGDRVSASHDDLGRQVMRLNQLRDLTQTAYLQLSTGTEATLLTGVAGVFYDLIYIMCANDSGAAVQVDIRGVTAGNKLMTIEVPANGTAGVSLPVPLPQDATGNNWTADMPDITGTNVYISALFSKEV